MSGFLSFLRDVFDDSRGIRGFSDIHDYTPAGLEYIESSMTSHLHLHLPEVWAPAQHLIDAGLRPTLARRLSSTYMHFVARYRKTCQSHFDRATRGRSRLTEYYREVFTVLFKRTIQASGSQIISIVRVHLCQAGAPQATVRPERIDASASVISKASRHTKPNVTQIRVDGAAKAEIMARLEATYLSSDRVVTDPSFDVASRLEEVSQQTYPLSTDATDSRSMLSDLSPISSMEVTSSPLDPFSQPAPPTCFPVPYPPPPEHSLLCSPQRALATSFVPPVRPRNVRPLAGYGADVSSLIDPFSRMDLTPLKTDSTSPKCDRMFGISGFNKIKTVPPSNTANFLKGPQLASIESISSPPKLTTTARRRKIAALPTRRGKTSASPTPTVSDLAGATSYSLLRAVEDTLPDHTHTSQQKPRLLPTTPLAYTAEAPYLATPKNPTIRQRRVHTLRKTPPQIQPTSQIQTLKPLATAGDTFSYNISRSPSLISDAPSYFDSPPTSSDELDTPPSTPPSSHVLLASTSTESLAISSESDRIVSHKEPLGDVKLPCLRQRYKRLDFTNGGLGRGEQPLTFTFSV